MFREDAERTGRHSAEALRLVSVHKVYGSARAGTAVAALDGVSLSLPAGGCTAVVGPSGSGKSTLLRCAAGLERPDGGLVVVDGAALHAPAPGGPGPGIGEAEVTRFRRGRIGFVFQDATLLPELTVLENVLLPLTLAGRRAGPGRAADLLARAGLAARAGHLPDRLSGGQRQRVAIVRALVTEPSVILADEPTRALDARGGARVLALLRESVAAYGGTVVMATHDPVVAAAADTMVFLADGRLVGRLDRPSAAAVAARMADPAGSGAPR